MRNIIKLLFQAKILKEIPRSGYHFLGSGRESVAEHSFSAAFVAFVMTHMESEIDSFRLISMSLVHDLTEARIGDLNSVQKRYVVADQMQALEDTTKDLSFGASLTELVEEFNQGRTREAKLARDADQIAFILDLKALSDIGYTAPKKWLPAVLKRLQTKTGKLLAENIMDTEWDSWWSKNYIDRSGGNK